MNKRLQATMQNSALREKLPSLPNFLQKLWVILNNERFQEVIRWDLSGESFRILDQQTFCSEILPNFFKHNNLNSFVRQLNLYGFRKVSSVSKNSFADNNDNLHFANQYFIRGQYHLLQKIKRNAAGTKQKLSQTNGLKTSATPGKTVTLPEEDLICLLQELKIVRERQSALSRDNILLWQEMAALRSSYRKQKENVGKLVQFLIGLGQHDQKRMTHTQTQRIVQLEELDNKTVQLNYNSNLPQNNSSTCLALQQNPPRFAALDCNILDGLQQELNEPMAPHSMSLDIETALLEGLQLRQRAIEEGAPYLDNGILSCDDQYQPIERPLSLRNNERIQYYEDTGGLHLKRPFQRRLMSPGSPSSEFYPKRALYNSNQNQELVPSTSRGRLPIRRNVNEQSVIGRAELQLAHPSNVIHHDASSPDGNEEMQFFVEDQNGQPMLFEEEFPDGVEDEDFEWQPEIYADGEEGDFSFINAELEEQESEEPSAEHHVSSKSN
jgi:transcription elongation GreA/GreB family factor